jgi:hypothetical protein
MALRVLPFLYLYMLLLQNEGLALKERTLHRERLIANDVEAISIVGGSLAGSE